MNKSPAWGTPFALLVLAAVVLAALVLVGMRRPTPVEIIIQPPPPTATPAPSPTFSPITVYVTGAVAQPGVLLSLPAGSRVRDALQAAGGVLPEADLQRVNLAAALRDGDQVHVPAQDDTPAGVPTQPGGELVFINQADAATLETLPDVGPALAQAIISYREANGPFATLEDLDAVPGIGPAALERLAERVRFD